MADTYMMGIPGYAHNGNTGTTDDQQGQLFKALLQQTMQEGKGSSNALSPIMQGLSTYMALNGMNQGQTVTPGTMAGMGMAGTGDSMGMTPAFMGG